MSAIQEIPFPSSAKAMPSKPGLTIAPSGPSFSKKKPARAVAEEMLLKDLGALDADNKENSASPTVANVMKPQKSVLEMAKMFKGDGPAKEQEKPQKEMTVSAFLNEVAEEENGDELRAMATWEAEAADAEADETPQYDLPERLVKRPESRIQINDLERCSKMIVDLKNMENQATADATEDARKLVEGNPDTEAFRAQGDIFFRERFMGIPRWRKRFASIVEHSYFGPVLFLFKYKSNGNVSVNNKVMIALEDCRAMLGANSKGKDGYFRCEFSVTTGNGKKYMFNTTDSISRDRWVNEIRQYIQK